MNKVLGTTYIDDYLGTNRLQADVTVFSAELVGNGQRITVAIYCGCATTHLRMTQGQVQHLIELLKSGVASVPAQVAEAA